MHHTSACGPSVNEVRQLGKSSQRQNCFNISRIWFITEAFLQQCWVMCLEVSEVLFLQWMEVVNTQVFSTFKEDKSQVFTLGSSKDLKAKILTGMKKFEQYN